MKTESVFKGELNLLVFQNETLHNVLFQKSLRPYIFHEV